MLSQRSGFSHSSASNKHRHHDTPLSQLRGDSAYPQGKQLSQGAFLRYERRDRQRFLPSNLSNYSRPQTSASLRSLLGYAQATLRANALQALCPTQTIQAIIQNQGGHRIDSVKKDRRSPIALERCPHNDQ
jgi:hypothetical protein